MIELVEKVQKIVENDSVPENEKWKLLRELIDEKLEEMIHNKPP